MSKQLVRSIWGAAFAVATVCAGLPGASTAAAGEDVDCASPKVHCVDDTPGPMQEFADIQSAVDRARKGHTVVVAAGDYAGFRVSRSGKKKRPIVIRGLAGARVVAPEGGSDDGIYLQRASWVTITGFEVDGGGSMRFGIGGHDASARKPMRGVSIIGNTVHDAASTNIYLSHGADSLIEGNVAYGSRASHGIYLANAGSDDTTIRGNTCYGNAVNGIHLNGDRHEGGDGVHTGILIEDNRVYDNDANGLDLDGMRDSTVRNNLIYGNGRHGVRAFAIDAAAGPADLLIVNNTIVDNGGWAVKLTQDDGGHVVFNNVLLSSEGSIVVDNPDLASDYNVVQLEFSLEGERTVISFAAWQSAGLDGNSVRAKRNKVFRKPKRQDYRLRKRSPAIDLGVAVFAGVQAPATDIDGAARPAGKAYDAGAYERGGQ